MRALVLGKEVVCELDGDRTYDRCIAICTIDGADIAAEMVRVGLARDCPRYSGGRYQRGAPRSARRTVCQDIASLVIEAEVARLQVAKVQGGPPGRSVRIVTQS